VSSHALRAWTRALALTAPIAQHPELTLPVLIDRLGERFGPAPALLSLEARLSYRVLAEQTRRYARWGLSQGLKRGDVVGLLMSNCPAYLAIWLGLSRIGVTVALLNTHVTGERLAYAIDLVHPRRLICGASLSEQLESARPRLAHGVDCWIHGAGESTLPRLDLAISSLASTPFADDEYAPPSLADRALCIYTSGTTGLPKAANISHFRVMQWSHWFAGLMDTSAHDRIYDCLPMYHSIGGVVAPGAVLVSGGTVVVRERFSSSVFWKDIAHERCTLFQYIGELCRYLLQAPPEAAETHHHLRLCCGNGLRAEVWEPFQQRFRIPHILEYYASTEGSFSLYNCDQRVGSIGRIPAFLSHRVPVALIAVDRDTGVPVRDASGRCVRCAPNEIGEAIGQLLDADGDGDGDGDGGNGSRFEGYVDVQATRQKILCDVFSPGDRWYRSGDLMRQDPRGYFYFVDRLGDAFRWQGENVSSTEVSSTLVSCDGVRDAVAYGVLVPGAEGRACMAALAVAADFDLQVFRREVSARLPAYARPLFLRIVSELDLTATFKLARQRLALEGFDPARTGDQLYWSDSTQQAYVRLDHTLYRRLLDGELRL
jgi:fatty-acyl-CoA synthase